MKVPVIYEMAPIGVDGADEAISVMYFCSEACRANYSAQGQDGESDDWIPGTVCTECCKPLTAVA